MKAFWDKVVEGFAFGLGFAFAWNIIGWLCLLLSNVFAHGAVGR